MSLKETNYVSTFITIVIYFYIPLYTFYENILYDKLTKLQLNSLGWC